MIIGIGRAERRGACGIIVGIGLATVLFAADPAPATPAVQNANKKIKELDRQLAALSQEKGTLIEGLREQIKVLDRMKAELEKEDEECRKIRARLEELEAEAVKLRGDLDRRLTTITRYAEKATANQKAMDRLKEIRELERKASLEKQGLLFYSQGGTGRLGRISTPVPTSGTNDAQGKP